MQRLRSELARARGSAWMQGVKAITPILLGVVPMAVVTGVAAVNIGMTTGEAILASLVMYAAAAQLVAYDMLAAEVDAAFVFSAAVVLNLRFLLYSAGMAPHLQTASPARRVLGAYVLSDQAYGITMVRLQQEPDTECAGFYLGAALFMWSVYQLFAALGAFLGAGVSPDLSLDFAVPLTFSALVVPLLAKPELRVAAAVSAVTALWLADLPNNAGFFAAAVSGIAAGVLYLRRRGGSAAV